MKTNHFALTLLLICFLSKYHAQPKAAGNNPASIHWQYYDSKAVKLIFPAGNEKEATRVINIINYIYDSLGGTVGPKRKHLDLLLQTNQVVSNGYVGLAPYRSEFYATGLQDFNTLGSANWLDLLSFHEYRHALQIANQRHGLTKFLSIVWGQNFWQLAQLASIPNWYMEGDAVQTESLFSGAGRGRTPDFFKGQKALLLGSRNYRYMKARNGSFKHFVPDHYRLGYAILHRVRNDHGPDVWAKILRQGSAFRGIFYPFSKAMKRNVGYSSRKAYQIAYDSLRVQWENELSNIKLTLTSSVTPVSKRTVTDYRWAHVLEDSSMIYRKESYKKTGELIHIKNGKEEKLLTFGIMTPAETYFSYNNGKIAWCEFTSDKRWQNRNYSEIRTYDMVTKKKTRLTSKTKLFAPEFSSKGDLLVAAKLDEHIKNQIVFIDAITGEEKGAIPNPDNDFVAYPTWTKDDKAIVFEAKRGAKIAILKYDIATQTIIELTSWSQQVVGPLTMGKEHVYFTASYTGINNIFATSLLGNKQILQISSVKINASMPFVSADEKTLYMSEFDYTGDQITKQSFDLANAQVVTVIEPEQQETYRMKPTRLENSIYTRIPSKVYEAKDYKQFIRGAKLHSWSLSGNQTEVSLGLSIDNILNDFSASITGGYNLNEKAPILRGRVDYSRYYLPVSLIGSVSNRSMISPSNLFDTGAVGSNTITFTESNYGGTIYLPLKWVNGIYSKGILLTAGASHIATSKYKLNGNDITNANTNNDLFVTEGSLKLTNVRARAYQNINPRFGQELNLYIGYGLSGATASKYSADATLYFPGLLRNHSLYFKGGYKNEKLSNGYRFMDNFTHARGYQPIQGDEEYMASVNYKLPLCYPDFGAAGIFYLQRIKLNLFMDYSQVTRSSLNTTFDQSSYGGELYFDLKVLNALPVSLGLRNSILMNHNYFNKGVTNRFEFFFAGTF